MIKYTGSPHWQTSSFFHLISKICRFAKIYTEITSNGRAPLLLWVRSLFVGWDSAAFAILFPPRHSSNWVRLCARLVEKVFKDKLFFGNTCSIAVFFNLFVCFRTERPTGSNAAGSPRANASRSERCRDKHLFRQPAAPCENLPIR